MRFLRIPSASGLNYSVFLFRKQELAISTQPLRNLRKGEPNNVKLTESKKLSAKSSRSYKLRQLGCPCVSVKQNQNGAHCHESITT
jgi:hypothetical protein